MYFCINLYLDEDVYCVGLKHLLMLLFTPRYNKVCSKMLSSLR